MVMSRFSAAQNTNLKLKNDLFEDVISVYERTSGVLAYSWLPSMAIVAFVSHKHNDNIWGCVVSQLLKPTAYILIRQVPDAYNQVWPPGQFYL